MPADDATLIQPVCLFVSFHGWFCGKPATMDRDGPYPRCVEHQNSSPRVSLRHRTALLATRARERGLYEQALRLAEGEAYCERVLAQWEYSGGYMINEHLNAGNWPKEERS
jgi:hypothetical protein